MKTTCKILQLGLAYAVAVGMGCGGSPNFGADENQAGAADRPQAEVPPTTASGSNPACPNPTLAPPAGATSARVLRSSRIVSVFWGLGVSAAVADPTKGISSFYRDLPQSPYFAWLAEYGVMSLDNDGVNYTITPTTVFPAFRTLDVNDVRFAEDSRAAVLLSQAEIRRQIATGKLPAPNADGSTIYALHFPASTFLGALVNPGTGAYHGWDWQDNKWEYLVVPDMGTIEATTIAESHEIFETVTDPDGSTGLRDRSCSGEIADICEGLADSVGTITVGANTWSVQKSWSNAAKQCVIDPAHFSERLGGRSLTWFDVADQWTTADYDGVNGPDIAHIYASGGQYQIEVVTNAGNGSLVFPGARSESNAGMVDSSSRWLTGDFDGNGLPDLARVFNAGGRPSIDLHLNNGLDASFHVRFVKHSLGLQPGGFSADEVWLAGDLNNDHFADIGVVWNDAGFASIGVLLNNKLGGFTSATGSPRVGGFAANQRWFLGNFDGDAAKTLDFAVGWNNGGTIAVTVMPNNGVARFTTRPATLNLGNWSDMHKWTAADFDGDGTTDLSISWNDVGRISTQVSLSSKTSFGRSGWQTRAGNWADSEVVLAGDFDRTVGNDLMIVWNDSGTGSFSLRPQQVPKL
jgi:hypothetical protein